MMLENETPLTFNTKDEKAVLNVPKKQTKKILLTVSTFLVLIGLFVYVILSTSYSDKKRRSQIKPRLCS